MMEQVTTLTCDNENCGEKETDEGAIEDKWCGFTADISNGKHNLSITSMSEVSDGDWADWSRHACSSDCLGPAIAQKFEAQTPKTAEQKIQRAKRKKKR